MSNKLAKTSKALNKLDFVISTGLVAYGLYSAEWLYVLGGVTGFGVAIWNPTEAVLEYIRKKFGAKKYKNAAVSKEDLDAKNAAYFQEADVESTANLFISEEDPALPATSAPFQGRLTISGVYLKSSKFNLYTPESIKVSVEPISEFRSGNLYS